MMKKSDLKKLIKPLVAECVQESIQELVYEAVVESGILSEVISEVMRGMVPATLVESRQQGSQSSVPAPVDIPQARPVSRMAEVVAGAERRSSQNTNIEQVGEEHQKKLEETLRQRLGGINIFEGTEPAEAETEALGESQSPLGGVSPADPGVSIDFLTGGRNYTNHL
jgi:hypothetical protein